MPAQNNIKCTVSNCRYYRNEMCHATAIEVNVDDGAETASDCKNTQCHTFEKIT